MLVSFPLLVLTVELSEAMISVNESDALYVACVNKSHSTVRPVTVEVVDIPGTAQRRIGNLRLRCHAWFKLFHFLIYIPFNTPP